MTTTKPAWQLHQGDVVLPESGSPPRVVLGAPLLQGADPVALVEFAGRPGRTHYPAAQLLTVEIMR